MYIYIYIHIINFSIRTTALDQRLRDYLLDIRCSRAEYNNLRLSSPIGWSDTQSDRWIFDHITNNHSIYTMFMSHYDDVLIGAIASLITILMILLLNRWFRRRSKKRSKLRVTDLCVGNSPGPVNSPHKWPVTRKMFPFDDVIMLHMLYLHPWISVCPNRPLKYIFLSWAFLISDLHHQLTMICMGCSSLHYEVVCLLYFTFRKQFWTKFDRQFKLRWEMF